MSGVGRLCRCCGVCELCKSRVDCGVVYVIGVSALVCARQACFGEEPFAVRSEKIYSTDLNQTIIAQKIFLSFGSI